MADKLILQLGWEDVYASLPHPSSLSRRICPSTIQYIFRWQSCAVCYKISSEIFFQTTQVRRSIESGDPSFCCVPSALCNICFAHAKKKVCSRFGWRCFTGNVWKDLYKSTRVILPSVPKFLPVLRGFCTIVSRSIPDRHRSKE